MEASLMHLRQNRVVLDQYFQRYNPEQLNTVPAGFNNNLIWNLGHILVVQQALTYRLSGLEMRIPGDLPGRYGRDTRPEGPVPQSEITLIRNLLSGSIAQLEADRAQGLFQQYKPFENSMGFRMTNLEEALVFNCLHEGLHLGYMQAIRKFL